MPADPGSDEAIFAIALTVESPAHRASYLEKACAGNPEQRARIEVLLAAQSATVNLSPTAVGPLDTIKFDYADSTDEAVGQTLGPYKLLEKLGEGGCGVVYVAEQSEPVRRRVALKVIKLGMDTKAVVARFEAERQALALMDHPNIARVLDAGTTEQGRPYFVMELVRGIAVTRYCDENRLNTRERLDLFIKVCLAIQHAHQKGIIHRDIKPSNILVTLHDGVPVPKVIDFGIAKATEGRLTDATIYTQLHQFIGTPAYMSPEQAEMSGLDIDTRSDIYSLGVLLYEMLTGRTPFDPKELMALGIDAMRKTIREREPARPSLRLATLPGEELTKTALRQSVDTAKLPTLLRGDLDWIVMKCLEKDRTRRYETANGLAADLKRHLNHEPVIARPPSTSYRLQKAWRRNRLAYTTVVAVATAMLVGILSIVFIQRAANQQLTHTLGELEVARRTITQQLGESRRSQAELTFRKGRELVERGDLNEGVFWLLESLKVTPEDLPAFERMVRINLASWAQHLPQLERPLPESSQAKAIAFSPDGASVLLGFQNGALRHLNLRTGRDLHPPRSFPDRMVTALDFHPNGRTFAIGLAGDGDRSTRNDPKAVGFDAPSDALIWDLATWSQLGPPMAHSGGVHSVQFTPDGTKLLTREYPGTVLRYWDPENGRLLGSPWTVDRHQLAEHLEFSPDSRDILLHMQQAGQSRLVSANEFHPAGRVNVDKAWLHTFHPDGRGVVMLRAGRTESGELRMVDPSTGAWRDLQVDVPQRLFRSGFGPNGRELYAVAYDATVRGWETSTGRSLGWIIPNMDLGFAAPDREGRFLINRLGQWRLPRTASRPIAPMDRVMPGGSGIRFGRPSHTAVAYTGDGLRVLTRLDGPQAGTTAAQLWDTTSGQPVGLPLRASGNTLSDVALSKDGILAATAAMADPGLWEFNAGFVELWDARTGARRLGPLAPNSAIAVLDFSPDGRLLAGGSYDGRVHLWDTQTGRETGEPLAHPEIVFAVRFSPDGTKLAVGTTHARQSFPHARIWDVTTRRPLFEPLAGFDREWVMFLEFTPDGRRLLVGTEWRATVWDMKTGSPLVQPERSAQRLFAQRLSPDGKYLATGDQSGVIRVVETETGRETIRPMQHTRPIQCVAFSPDGKLLASGSTEGLVRLWDLETAQPLGAPFTHHFPVFGVTFTEDGKSVISSDSKGRSRIWPLPEPGRGTPSELSALLESRTLQRLDRGVVRRLTATEVRETLRHAQRTSEALRLETPLSDEAWHQSRANDAEDDHDWFGALWHLKALAQSERASWWVAARIGRAHARRGDTNAAQTALIEAARLANIAGDTLQLGPWLRHAAFAARQDRDWKAARWLLDRLITASSPDWQLLADRAEANSHLGDTNRAMADFSAALDAAPTGVSVPVVAAKLAVSGQWAALAEEYARIEKAGWLFREDWRRYGLALLRAEDTVGFQQLVERLSQKAGSVSWLPNPRASEEWTEIERTLRANK